MEIFLSPGALGELNVARRTATSKQANERVDTQTSVIRSAVDRMAVVKGEEGARHSAAAALLLRAVDLLEEVRSATMASTLQHLGIRTAFELSVVGRYFLVAEGGHDEFVRRFNDSVHSESQLAAMFEFESPGPPDFLEHLINPNAKPPRPLRQLAQDLDAIDGYPADSRYSAESCYGLLHKHVSNMMSHANLASVKYHVDRDGDVLFVRVAKDVTDKVAPTMIVACFIGELADDVFRAFDLPIDGLPVDVRRPRPEAA